MRAGVIAREGNGDGDVGGAVCDADDEVGGAEQSSEGWAGSEGKDRHIGGTAGDSAGIIGREREERVGELMAALRM